MTTTQIHHDRERFMSALRGSLADPERGGALGAVDVITRDARPGELLLVAMDDVTRTWYSDDRVYGRYQDAFMALGRYLDEMNPGRIPLTWHWEG